MRVLTPLVQLLLVSAAVAVASFTVTRAPVFGWLRTRARELHRGLGELLSCAYCLGHWLAAVAWGLVRRPVVVDPWWANWGVLALATVALASAWNWLIFWGHAATQNGGDDEA